MHVDMYRDGKKDKLFDVSFPKILVICITILTVLVIPMQVITLLQDGYVSNDVSVAQQGRDNDTAGRVAGASTSAAQETSEISIDLAARDTQFFLLGFFFLSVALLTFIYLIFSARAHREREFDVAFHERVLSD